MLQAPEKHRWRRLAPWVPAVVLAHVWLVDAALESTLGWGEGKKPPPRFEVNFVQVAAPSEPPLVVAPAAPAARPPVQNATARAPALPAPSASAPQPTPAALDEAPAVAAAAPVTEPAPASVPAPVLAASAPPPSALAVASAASAATLQAAEPVVAVAVAVAAAASAAAPAFEWPPSTRLSYTLSGHYRGPVEGLATVEWLRSGLRYQVRMVLNVGPAFAPLLTRLHASEGDLTPQGLRPRRYDEESKVVFREPRRLTMWLDDTAIRLPDGRTLPRPEGIQDSASQFLQLLWLFTHDPGLLKAGRSIDMPLALPRHLDTWRYEVKGAEQLETPVGSIATVHVKPTREPRPGVELTAEMWVAPSLQYLPVRLLIRQDAQTYVDLLLNTLPQQAAAGR